MRRRDFIKYSTAAALAATGNTFAAENTSAYEGPILATFKLSGGIDQSCLVDPKADPEINHWARGGTSYGTAGNLRYAPMAWNSSFFPKYSNHCLVFNGVSLGTNSHSVAASYRQRGTKNTSYPHINELFAAARGQGMPFAYMVDRIQSVYSGLTARTVIPGLDFMEAIANPNLNGSDSVISAAEYETISRYLDERHSSLINSGRIKAEFSKRLKELSDARAAAKKMKEIESLLPDELDVYNSAGEKDLIISRIHLFLITAAAGMSCSGKFALGRWDTHYDHDSRISNQLDSTLRRLDYLWTKAAELGIDDRLVSYVTSDVGRRPFYNSKNGKDHYTYASEFVMKKDAGWGNRVVGISGPAHEKMNINAATLAADDAGIELKPEHIHTSLRKILGIDGHRLSEKYFLGVNELPLLNASLSSGYK